MILITNARIFTMAGKTYESGCILIAGKTIIDVNKDISVSKNNDHVVLDAKGSWVLPGLIDTAKI